MRAADDRCETFIIDEGWMWFRGAARSFMPDWFREAIRYSDEVPPAPPTLREEGRA
jgi:alpha-galactosidase